MRVIAAIIIVSSVGFTTARAADVPSDGVSMSRDYVIGERAGPVVVYDYQPGVVVRAYWQSPWRNHHYYPSTGKRPKVGRAENLSAPRPHYRMAESYHRAWSTNALFPPPVVASVPVSKISGPLK
ncbi:MAG TPA: hypothetical protein VGM57_16445 [Pseudolabrys sp.]